MEQFIEHTGIAAPLLRDNIDTDLLIPSREMTSPAKDGYGEKLLADWRYLPSEPGGPRIENPEFVLNRPAFRHASILIAGKNFGSGSSREAAAWALRQFGFRGVIAPSFGTIFQNNCYRNGVVPVVLPLEDVQALAAAAEGGTLALTVDLERCLLLAPSGRSWPIAVPSSERTMLLEGLDVIGLTLKNQAQIEAFEVRNRETSPWLWQPVMR